MDKLEGAVRLLSRYFTSDKLVNMASVVLELTVMIIVGLLVLKFALSFTRKALDKSSLDSVLYTFVLNAIKAIGIIILVTMCLGLLGIQMSTIIAVIGAAGAAIALALKDSLANIAGGVMIIVTKPFKRDDFIDVGDVSGEVKDIDLFITTLKTYDNKTITIPNGLINTSILINHSKEGMRRVDCRFSISYGSDISEVKEILKEVCNKSPLILKDPEPVIGVAEQGDSAIIMNVFAWCDTKDYWTVKYFLEEHVKNVFDEKGINIPYPIIDVRIQK